MIFIERLVAEYTVHSHSSANKPEIQHYCENENEIKENENTDHKSNAIETHKNYLWSFMIGLLTHAAIDG